MTDPSPIGRSPGRPIKGLSGRADISDMTRISRLVLSCLLTAAALFGAAVPASAWEDVAKGSWAEPAINHVAGTKDWMRDYGPDRFEPAHRLSRRHLARAIVKAFAPAEEADP